MQFTAARRREDVEERRILQSLKLFFPTKWQQEVNNEKSSVKAFLFARFFTKIIFIVGEVTMRK
jgi:hypothetical protein